MVNTDSVSYNIDTDKAKKIHLSISIIIEYSLYLAFYCIDCTHSGVTVGVLVADQRLLLFWLVGVPQSDSVSLSPGTQTQNCSFLIVM